MNIWLIVPYEPIPPIDKTGRYLRYGILANELAKNIDNNITWWTSDFDHVQKKNRFGRNSEYLIKSNLSVNLLFSGSYSKNISFARIRHNISLSREFKKVINKIAVKPDIIICCLPTLELGEQVVNFASTNDIPIIVDIVDIWPDVYLTIFPKQIHSIVKLLLKSEYNRAKIVLDKAFSIIAVSETYLNWGLEIIKRPRSQTDKILPLGYSSSISNNEEVIKCQEKFSNIFNIKPDTLVLTFIGQFEKSYDIETVVEAAKYFSDNDNVKFILAGNGKKYLHAQKESKGLKNLYLTGWLNQSEISALLRLSSVGLVAYSKTALQTLPYKPFEYMSAGLPLLSSLNGEFKNLIEENKIGKSYLSKNVNSLCSQINWFLNNKDEVKRMGQRSSLLFFNKYNNEVIYPGFVEHIYDTYRLYHSQKNK